MKGRRMQAPDLGRDGTAADHLSTELVRDMDRDQLSRLVRDANDAGESYQQLADRAIDPASNTTLSKPYLQKLATNTVTTAPSPERLRALAVALRKPLSVVQRAAAAQYFDYEATELAGYDAETRIIVAHLAGMSPGERRRWRAMIEAAEQVSGDDE